MTNMKIVQINTVFRNGGSTGRIAYDLMLAQKSAGIEAYAAYGYDTRAEHTSNTFCMQGFLRRKFNILRTRLFDNHGFYNEFETDKLLRWLDIIHPDIIHLHNIHNHYIHVGKLFEYIKKNDISVVWTLHDCWSFTGHCAHFDYANCEKWKTGCNKCPCLKEYPPTWFFDRSLKNYEDKKNAFCGVKNMTIITPSRWLADFIPKSFLKNYPVKVINNGVDIQKFIPNANIPKTIEEQTNGKKVILAMAAGLGERKGGGYIKQLPPLLNEDEILLLVGGGARKLASLFPNKCIGIEYTNNVNELAGYYSLADVFINPTLEDNFPTTNIEAMSCGTPVVTFRTGGSIESVLDDEIIYNDGDIEQTKVGMVVPKGDISSMLCAIRKIEAKGKLFFADSCRNKVIEKYEKNKQYQEYIKLYQNIFALR